MYKKTASGIILTLLLVGTVTLSLNIHPVIASLPVHNVDTGLDYATIQEAIDAPQTLNGHGIQVDSGTYIENVMITKSLAIYAKEGPAVTTVKAKADGHAFDVQVDYVTIMNFSVTNEHVGHGMMLYGVTHCNIYDNIIYECTNGLAGNGIFVYGSYNNITNNTIHSNFRKGIGMRDSNFNRIENNTIVSNAGCGIELRLCDNCIIGDNKIQSSRGATYPGFGLRLASSDNNNVTGNMFIANEAAGVYIDSFSATPPGDPSHDNLVYENTFVMNGLGVEIAADYEHTNNMFYHNNFIENIAVDPWTNIWDDGYPSGGNYWSGYTGVDFYSGPYQNETGSDGIGDTPYSISGGACQDSYPLMESSHLPFHEVIIKSVACSSAKVYQGDIVSIETTVTNPGDFSEIFNVTLYANDVILKKQQVTASSRSSQTMTFDWNTTTVAEGIYTIIATASIVPGETQTSDNIYIDGSVSVSIFRVPLVLVYPQITFVEPDETFTIDVCVANVVDLDAWQVELIFNSTMLTWISGGRLQGSSVVAFGWLGSYTGNCTLLQITFKYVTGSISSLRLSGTRTKLWDESNSVIVFQAVDGEVKVAQNYVTDVTPCKSIVGQGYPIKINVTVENRGYLTETFKVTVYANLVSVASQNVTLTGQSSTTLNFTWITAGFAYGNYTIEATADNTYVNGIIVVTVPGDVTGEIWVDMQDISLLIEKFMTTPSDPRWDPNCDINGDLSVDMADISIAIDHFMQA